MRNRLILTGFILAGTALSTTPALAKDTPDGPDAIVVTGERLEKTARTEQKQAPNIVDIQSAEAIAKYPDVNAAEAISRIPGVSLSIDTAEGRFVNIRGLDGNLNGATFGGVVLLNTQPGGTYFNSSGRAVEFDTVPIGAIDRIVVTKTGLPDHEAEGIGGSVELTPRTAIGLKKPFADITLGGGIETFRGKGLYRDEIVVGAPFGGVNANGDAPFSFVVSQFLYNDHRSFDDLEEAYVDNQPVVPDKAFAALELRKYDYYRQRFGYSGEFDFTPESQQRFYLRASLAGYNEHVYRNRFLINFTGAPTVDPANANGFIDTIDPASNNGPAAKTLRDEDETHKNLVLQAGGNNQVGVAQIEYFAAYSRATYNKHFDYNSEFDNPNVYTINYDNITNPNYPAFKILTGTGFTNPANYALASIGNGTENDRDEEYSYAASVALPVNLTPGDELRIGGKLRYREKVTNPYRANYSYAGAPYLLSSDQSGGNVTNFYHAGYDIGPYINGDPLRTIFDQSGTVLKLQNGNYFDDIEDVTAAFAQYHATFGSLGVLAGVRYEHTRANYAGLAKVTDAMGNTTFMPNATAHSYDDFFPTVQLRYQAMPELVLRATYSTGLARPGFYQTTQSASVDLGAQTVSVGNPNLKPTYSNNFDASVEYYLPDNGIVSISGFDKEMTNYIVTFSTLLPNGYLGNPGIFNESTYQNLPAYARGLELQFVDKFRGLPGLLDGFGVDTNLTYVDSQVQLRTGEFVPLPGTFKYSWNAALFYEKGPAKLRLSSQYESSVLFGVGGSRATDVFQDNRFTLDFEGSYDITKGVQVYLNAKNLTNAPLRFYEGTPNRPIQREFYLATFEAGVKLHF